MPLVGSLKRFLNGVSNESEAKSPEYSTVPWAERGRSCHKMSGQISERVACTSSRFQREMPSAAPFMMPQTCLASNFHLCLISRKLRIRIKAPDIGSFPSRYLLNQ